MPTYEYRCPKGHEFELVQKMSDEPGAACPEGGGASERLISRGGGLLFKGEGFYITDYRSKEYKKSAEAESGAGKGSKAPEKKAEADASGSSPTPKPSSKEPE